MDLQLREKEIFETIKKIIVYDFVVIGGYAVNAYTLPRFSVDCDIVVRDNRDSISICNKLKKLGYCDKSKGFLGQYNGAFIRYEKELKKNFLVSMDILIGSVLDRQTNSSFSADWVFNNSSKKILSGKTVTERVNTRIINIDALIVMKMSSLRSTDIRDVFMLLPYAENYDWIRKEISKRCDFSDRINKFVKNIKSKKFKDNLQGVFGYIDDNVFMKHIRAAASMLSNP